MIPQAIDPVRPSRSGITLTEILISILIMGVGLVSLATLFPLGILRMRAAARDSRSTLLAESAIGDMYTRGLLVKSSFLNPLSCPWYGPSGTGYAVNPGYSYDPFTQDTASYLGGGPANSTTGAGVFRSPLVGGPGLPFCYDPLFRANATNPNGPPEATANATPGVYLGQPWGEARFGFGGTIGADGLQRITNFDQTFPPRVTVTLAGLPLANFVQPVRDLTGSIFASPDDLVFFSNSGAQASSFSPLIPDRTTISTVDPLTGKVPPSLMVSDWNYTWFFTGRQADVSNDRIFDGEIVVCHNRPLSVAAVGGSFQVEGETVVQAIWGHGARIARLIGGQTAGYAAGANRTVLLFWPIGTPDPVVTTGSWIADVTYERTTGGETAHLALARTIAANVEVVQAAAPAAGIPNFPIYDAQRCNWYQVAKKTPIISVTTGPLAGTRQMVVTVSTPLKAQTLLSAPFTPVRAEAALIMPSVVNVFPKTFSF